MSIEKYDFTDFEQEGLPHSFTMINNAVIQNIRDPEALAVWCYLITKPPEWKPCKAQLRSHFNMGINKMNSIFGYLNTNLLIDYISSRKQDGTIIKHTLVVKNGKDFLEKVVLNQTYLATGIKTVSVDLSTGMKIMRVDYHVSGKTAPINKDIKINKEKTERGTARKKPRATLSADFQPDQKRHELCGAISLKVGTQYGILLTKFINLQLSSGKESADWNAEFENFLLRERKEGSSSPSPSNRYANLPDWTAERLAREASKPRPVSEFCGPGHPSYDSLHR